VRYYPSKQEFRSIAETANLIPVYAEVLADMETPVSAFLKATDGDYRFLLESVEGGERLARYSFMGSEPFLVFRAKGNHVVIEQGGSLEVIDLAPGRDPLHILKQLMNQYRWSGDPSLPPFCGGAVGYIGYDAVRHFERLPDLTPDDLKLPDYLLMFTDAFLVFDHVRHSIRAVCNARVSEDPDAAYDSAVAKVDELIRRLRDGHPKLPPPPTGNNRAEPTSNVSRDRFLESVLRAKEYIAAGDIIQVVLSQRLSIPVTAHPLHIYRALRFVNPSPYMYYLSAGDIHIVGSSPEILVSERNGVVTTRPIAGTTRRGATEEEDQKLADALLSDEKERAEHIMLVDLGRNDLGRVCSYGTVKVDEFMAIEKYSHVMHIVSNVTGRLSPDKDQFDVLRACFPAGTVSGAPKIRAMEIIEELEPTKRGPYAGAVGYFSYSGSMDTAITIRTITLKGNTAYVQVGAGVVADSIPEREFEETMRKGHALLRAIEMAEAGLP
jgi:anthranilate synthase component 1